ncbi:MAG TPA: hypothetical protein VKT28_12830 [Puia sp.]|nr:hypothetical protein [Puia sp.]
MKKIAPLFLLFASLKLSAQLPEDALRTSWNAPSGTARQQAIGGAMGSLGGEISATFVNPAGLGFYKTSEIVLSPGFRFLSDKSSYRGTNASGNTASNFNMGTSGFIFSGSVHNNHSLAVSIAVNRTANFNSDVLYKGQNNYSSYAEQYAIEFANSGLSINDALGGTQVSYGTRMALYTYLIDTATVNGSPQVIAQPVKNQGFLLNQQNQFHSRGGITEIAIGVANNSNDKLYLGGTLGFPIMNYKRNLTFTETDATGNANNDFASSVYSESYSTKGGGFNLKLGMIYKLSDALRVGVAIHTPSVLVLKDEIHAKMITNTESYAGTISMSSDSLDYYTQTTANQISYVLITPWHFLLSASYLFGAGIEDVGKQKGFITADVEYVTNRSSRYSEGGYSSDDASLDYGPLNGAIKDSYKGNFNFKVGGEMKFNTFMGRLGFAYSTSPYKQSALKADRMYVSGGLGYRNKGMFIDLAYIQNIINDVNFPYRLADKANTFANLKDNGGTVMVTVGMKF